MQALIDFEGWRKWRGFAHSSEQATANRNMASPMQGGEQKTEQSAFPGFSKASTPKPDPTQDGNDPVPRPTDAIVREDSSVSGGSGSTGDSIDSSSNLASPATHFTR